MMTLSDTMPFALSVVAVTAELTKECNTARSVASICPLPATSDRNSPLLPVSAASSCCPLRLPGDPNMGLHQHFCHQKRVG